MRKVLISLLLASAFATPALAAPHRSSDRDSAREERQAAREDRQEARQEKQSAREERSDRSNTDARPQFQAPQRADRGDARANFTAPARVQATGRADARDVEALRFALRSRLACTAASRCGFIKSRRSGPPGMCASPVAPRP